MKKDNIRRIIALAVVLVLYVLVAFMLPFAHTATFWVSFTFTLISFCVAEVSMRIAFGEKKDARSRFYGCPIAKIGVVYGAVQLVTGLVSMALASYISERIVILIYAVGLGAAVLGLIATEATVSEIHVQDAKLKKNVALMRSLQSKVGQLAVQSEDPKIKALADEFRCSDPVSSEALAEIEQAMLATVDELEIAVADGHMEAARQLCRKASEILTERNHLCKLHK